MKKAVISDFDFKYYKDVKEKDGKSELARARAAYNEIKKMIDDFDNYKSSLLLHGKSGLGKTYLASCAGKALIDKGYSVLYVRSNKLFSLMEDMKFGRLIDEADSEKIKSAYSCDLLILDDLGTELTSKFTSSFLLDIVNERMITDKKMIITTNLTLEQLEKIYSSSFKSRLYESFLGFRLTGEDIRKQKMNE